MKKGTLNCWLFGHKTAIWSYKGMEGTSTIKELQNKPYCIRCGATE